MSKSQFTKKLGSKSQCTDTNSYPNKTDALLENSLNVSENSSFIEVFKSYKVSNNITSQKKATTEICINECITKNSEEKPRIKEIHNSNVVKVTNSNDVKISANYNEEESTDLSSVSTNTEIVDLFSHTIVHICPICFKKNTFDLASGFISHLKSCALKNNVSTEQLLKAVKLQEKQTIERVALGLPAVAKERQTVRRSGGRKKPLDANLELAIALSTSLRESEMLDKLKATETLLEAGLEQEAMSECKQLEDFGFISSKPVAVEAIPQKTIGRSKNIRNTILFTRSQEERERIITEKVAIILVDSDGQSIDPVREISTFSYSLRSVFLKNHRDRNSTLWTKSYQSCGQTSDEEFYVKTLSNFISPCKVKVGEKLKHVSQIPCRPSTQKKNVFDAGLCKLAELFAPKEKAVAAQNVEKNFQKCTITRDTDGDSTSKLSYDWKTLLNKNVMSDITIYARNEVSIFAHKLVLYVRCQSILSDTIKESAGGKCTEILMWMEYSCESVVAFLEYIYTGVVSNLKKLTEPQIIDLKILCSRYHVTEFEDFIDRVHGKQEMFASDELTEKEIKYTLPAETNETIMSPCAPLNDGEKNLLLLQDALKTQKSGAPSPEMFECETSSTESEVECKNVDLLEPPEKFYNSAAFDSVSPSKLLQSNSIPNIDRFHSIGLCVSPKKSPDKLISTASSTPISIVELNSNKSTPNKSFVENIMSMLCSPINARKNESSEIIEKKETHDSIRAIPLISPIKNYNMDMSSSFDDDNFHKIRNHTYADSEIVNKLKPSACPESFDKKLEKRKSCSPLKKSPVKKSRKTTSVKSYVCRKDELFPSENNHVKPRRRTKRVKKSTLSQSYSISDSYSTSDSDASLYKIEDKFNKTALDSACEFDLPEISKPKTTHVVKKIDAASISDDTSFEIDDFRRAISEEPETNSYVCRIKNENEEVENHATSPLPSDHVTDFKLKIDAFGEHEMNDAEPSPYVSPVWDGFENANYNHFDMCYSFQCQDTVLASSSPQPKTPSGPKSRRSKNTFDGVTNEKSCTSSFSQPIEHKSLNDPFFDSLSIDESVLNKVESNVLNAKNEIKTPEVKTVTPKDVRKFKCRSKSDTSLTPTTKDTVTAVTPLADYSNMKSTDLKKELDKYGLKPGLSRNKAKQLLRYIYNQLHPFEDQVNVPMSNEQAEKNVEKTIFPHGSLSKKNSLFPHKSPSKKNLNSKTAPTQIHDSDDSSSTVSTGVGILEESFVDDDVNARTLDVEDTRSKAVALDIGFRNLIQADKALHEKILLYEPIWLEPLKNTLKENGVKCSMNDLMNYLDEKCITFRTQQQRGTHRKRRKKKDASGASNI